ncbi:unnamed protein product [Alopecurus aequalis]
MASQPAPTTITALGDDFLREIFLRLPDLPSLVRAAFACLAFRRAVASSPAFRRSFRALHPPPLIAFFLEPTMEVVPLFPSPCNRPDPGLLAADFFGIRCVSPPRATGWEIQSRNPSADGYLILTVTGSTKQKAAYSPLMQALDLILYQPDVSFQFYTLSSQDVQGPSHVVCVRHQHRLAESTAFVFSSETMEWQISRKASLRLRVHGLVRTCMVVRGLICWRGWMWDQIVLFDTATCHFSLIDLPPTPFKTKSSTYKLGETKDEKLCVVDMLHADNTLVSWFMTTTTTDDSAAERWMMYRKFSLHPIVNKFTGFSIEEARRVRVDLVAVIDGFVYLSIFYNKDMDYFEVYLSISLETSEISQLLNGACRRYEEAHPYVMPWPPSLVQNKEESETGFMGDSVAGPMGTNEASIVLVTTLGSFRQALMNDSDSNNEIVAQLDAFLGPSKDDEGPLIMAQLDAFLGPSKDDEGPLISKMTTLDAQLRTARDRILRIRA